jgi:amidase
MKGFTSPMDVHYESLLRTSERIRRRELAAAEVTADLLRRIATFDSRLNSTVIVLGDSAMAQAERADIEIDAGNWRGPLHGIPIGVKDLLWTRGVPTAAGLDFLRDFLPPEDATVVARLRDAGAVVIAKLQMTEGATLSHHPSFGRPTNPWSADHWTGVSSSGSGVATAAGFCFGAIASDTDGSIRMPSAANNLTGIKPTWGRVSRHGVIACSETFDHIGPVARSAADAAAILRVIAGPDRRDPTTLATPVPDYLARMADGVAGLTLGIDDDAGGGLAAEIVEALDAASTVFTGLGMRIRPVKLPWTDETSDAMWTLTHAEFLGTHEKWFPRYRDRYGAWMLGALEQATHFTSADIAKARVIRTRYRAQVEALYSDVDLILTPSLGVVLPTWERIEQMERREIPVDPGLQRFISRFSFAGVPTISLPAGVDASGLPLGVQLAGPWLSEATLIRAGVAFQERTDFHERHPVLA